MNDSRVNKTIKFEGAGWAGADTSKATDMKNCRVRTTFINDRGQKIYLEIGCVDNRKRTSKARDYQHMDMPWHISHIFYTKDKSESRSTDFDHAWKQTKEFTKENVLKFLNRECNASFENIETINWSGDRDNAEWDGFSHTGKKEDDFHNEDVKE